MSLQVTLADQLLSIAWRKLRAGNCGNHEKLRINNSITILGYDANGNSAQLGNVVGPYNELKTDANFTYTYDNEGHRATRTAKVGGAFTQYSYDNRGRLVSVTDKVSAAGATTQQVFYNYDGLNRKVGQTVVPFSSGNPQTAVTTGYVYDGVQILVELNGTTVTRTNLWGPGTDHLMASDLGNGGSAITVWPR